MPQIQINDESLPKRCEVCHQSDMFDSSSNYCSRCKTTGLTLSSGVHTSVVDRKITINIGIRDLEKIKYPKIREKRKEY